MRSTHTLFQCVAMVLAAMALTAPSAFGAIEVKTEPNPGKHCAAVTVNIHSVSGGCGLHGVNTELIRLKVHNATHTLENVVSLCNFEFEARIDESGLGEIYDQVLSGPDCFIEPCMEADEFKEAHGAVEIWPFDIVDLGATEQVELDFCAQTVGSEVEGTDCLLHIPIIKLGHVYTLNAKPEAGCEDPGDEREVEGRWTFEHAGEAAHTKIEIVNT